MVIIANPDVLFEEKLIKSMIRNFEKNDDYAVLTGVMTRPDGSVDKVPYRNLFSYSHDLFDCFVLVRRLVYEKKTFEIDKTVEVMPVEVVQGSFFGIRSSVLEEINYLDDHLFLYYEELILGRKLKDRGYVSGLITNCTYLHNHSVSINKSMKRIRIWKAVLKSK